jgi:PAS domain S-box-containing protein
MVGCVLFIEDRIPGRFLSCVREEMELSLTVVQNPVSSDVSEYDIVCISAEKLDSISAEGPLFLVVGTADTALPLRSILIGADASTETFRTTLRSLILIFKLESENAALKAESERTGLMLGALFDSGLDAFMVLDDLTVIDANEETFRLFGLSRDRVIGASVCSLFPDALHEGNSCPPLSDTVRSAAVGKKECVHMRIVGSNGESRTAEIMLRGIVLLGRRLVLLNLRDISERIRSKRELETKEELLSDIISTAPLGIVAFTNETDPQSNTLRVGFLNDAFTRITGYEAGEIKTGMDWWLRAYPDEQYRASRISAFTEMRRRTPSNEPVGPIEAKIRCRDGSEKYIFGYYVKRGEHTLFFAIDITETMSIREALIESQKKLEEILRFLPDPTFAIDLEGKIIFWNRAIEELTGAAAGDMIGSGDHEYSMQFYGVRRDMLIDFILNPESPSLVLYKIIRHEGDSLYAELRRTLPDGKIQHLWGKASPLYDREGRVVGAMESIRDITGLKESENRLRESEEKFRSIFETMPLGFFRTGLDGSIIEMNPACAKMFGYASREEMTDLLRGNVAPIYVNPDERKSILEKVLGAKGAPVRVTVRMRKNGGAEFSSNIIIRIVSDSEGSLLYFEGLIEDISERELLQQVMIQSEKMSSVAGLAAGMAHEINNPLGIILQMAENAERRLFEDIPGNAAAAERAGVSLSGIRSYVQDRKIDSYLKGIRQAGVRAARIVSNMLQFSRTSSDVQKTGNIEAILDRTIELVSNDYDLKNKYDFRRISIDREYRGVPRVMCSEIQIEQVFLNILKNAAHAMRDRIYADGETPSIRISTRVERGDVVIDIRDNGPGMDEDVRKKIFEPFFTTKAPGSGTGLGLSVSYFIISGHGGNISVSSQKGTGSCFTIRLPAAEEEAIESDNSHS